MSTKQWSFRTTGETLLVTRADAKPSGGRHQMHPLEAAFFVKCLPSTTAGRDRLVRADLVSIAEALDGLVGHAERMSTQSLKDLVAGALRDKRLIAYRTTRPVVQLQIAEVPTLGPEASPVSWIEVVLVDQDKKPVPDERYLIKTSDGKIWSGTTDLNGKVRLEDIQPGDCDVSFPDLDPGSWTAL